jgi:ribosomal-protein-alanine N-acetyltransferase
MISLDAGLCELRTLQPADAETMARYANNEGIWQNVRDYFPHPYRLEDAQTFIATEVLREAPQNLGIIYQETCIGVIGFYPMQDVYRLTADFGYWIGEPFWGKGITSAAISIMVEYIFANTGIIRLQSSVFAFNEASMRVLTKNGFTLDCISRKGAIKNGVIIYEYRFSRLKT